MNEQVEREENADVVIFFPVGCSKNKKDGLRARNREN